MNYKKGLVYLITRKLIIEKLITEPGRDSHFFKGELKAIEKLKKYIEISMIDPKEFLLRGNINVVSDEEWGEITVFTNLFYQLMENDD